MDEKAVARCRKLLAMVEGGATEAEVAAATQLLQRELARAHMEMSDIQGADEGERVVREEDGWRSSTDGWYLSLADVVAQNMRCRVFVSFAGGQSTRRQVVFLGHEGDASLAHETFRAVLSAARRLYRGWARQERAARRERERRELLVEGWSEMDAKEVLEGFDPISRADKNGFYTGFAIGLSQGYEAALADSPQTALAVTCPADVAAWEPEGGFTGEAVPGRRASKTLSGIKAGREAGYGVGVGDRLA